MLEASLRRRSVDSRDEPAMTTEAWRSSRRSRARLSLQAYFGLEAREIAEDRDDRERATRAPHAHQAVLIGDIAFDDEVIPALGVAHIVDGHVVVLAPEERNRIERLAPAQHVESRGLTLSFRHDPMLDANGLAGESV